MEQASLTNPPAPPQVTTLPQVIQETMLPIQELATLLVKQFGYHEGLFDLALEFQVGIGRVGPTPETQFPGAMMAIQRIGLARAEVVNPMTVDASKVNPAT